VFDALAPLRVRRRWLLMVVWGEGERREKANYGVIFGVSSIDDESKVPPSIHLMPS
jgi:hypothetical protein